MPTVLSPARSERTIAREAVVRGIGFVTERDASLRFRPAEEGTGVVFVRADLPDAPAIPAHVRHVVPRQRRTALQCGEAVVEMVEHVLAALAGLRIDNCRVELDGPETPGCDGSSLAFVEALTEAGVVEQRRPREVLVVQEPVTVREGGSSVAAFPGESDRLTLAYHLDYGPQTPIGSQSLLMEIEPDRFRTELAPSRTFLLAAEAEAMRQAGLGRRLGESDLLIFGPDGPINNTLRYADECVRHKMLDMVGDLALAGCDLVGHVVAHRSGHSLNAALVRAILESATPSVAAPVLDIRSILKILPHRYPFLLIDRVIELDGTRHAVAIKNVTYNEPFFQGHWPDRPVMPGVLILESLAQAAGILIAQWADPRVKNAMIASIDEVKLRRPVVPGDQLRLEVETLRGKGRSAEMRGRATVDGQLTAEARLRFVIFDAHDSEAA